MKSGLYVLPGASATACAAAAASSFDFPITNVWNVYRSLSGVVGTPALSTVAGWRGATKKSICGRCWRSSCTRNTTAVGRPNTRSAARASTVACFDSFHSTANWSGAPTIDRKSTRLNSSHVEISYAVFCLKKKKKQKDEHNRLYNKAKKNERQ